MLNKAILMGRLTKEPEVSQTPSGLTVTRFSLAVDRSYVPKGGERETDFLNIVCFNKTAEFVSKYFSKGQLAYVVGSIQVRSWVNTNSEVRYVTEIIADEVGFGGTKKDNADNAQAANVNTSSQEKSDDEEVQEILSGFQPIQDDDSLPF